MFGHELPSLKLRVKAPENGWLEYDCFLLGPGLFSGSLLVSGSVTAGTQSHGSGWLEDDFPFKLE